MGNYWISFLEMTDLLIQNIHACHVRNLPEYLSLEEFDTKPFEA